jgi:phosphoglycolate phosphatase-like HAD superfamily hydrolase
MRPLFAFDVDGTLIDTRPSFTRIVQELSGANDDELRLFRDTGGFNDDWELTRALIAWIAAGRPKIVARCENVRDVVLWCGHDPGDLAERCIALYRGGYWRDERVLLPGKRLRELEALVDVVACTGRDAWEFEKGQELLGHRFASSTTSEQARKPDPQALLRLLPSSSSSSSPSSSQSPLVVLFGDTHADRRTVLKARTLRPDLRFAFVLADEDHPVAAVVDAVLSSRDPERALAFAEPVS